MNIDGFETITNNIFKNLMAISPINREILTARIKNKKFQISKSKNKEKKFQNK